jgi:hypothetical protein
MASRIHGVHGRHGCGNGNSHEKLGNGHNGSFSSGLIITHEFYAKNLKPVWVLGLKLLEIALEEVHDHDGLRGVQSYVLCVLIDGDLDLIHFNSFQ